MELMCSICLDTLFSVNNDVYVTSCGHLFHKGCLESSMQNNLQCPNCNTGISTGSVNKIHPDVFDDLVYNDCSIEAENVLEEIYGYENERKKSILKIIKKLDREYTSLKKTNTNYQKHFETCILFLKGFQTDINEWKEEFYQLKLVNNKLLAELRTLSNDNEVMRNESEKSQVRNLKQHNCMNNTCIDSSFIGESLVSDYLQMRCFESIKEMLNGIGCKRKILQPLNGKLDECSTENNANGFSCEIQNRVDELDECNRKLNNLLFKTIFEFENNNEVLKIKNKGYKSNLEVLKICVNDAQTDAKYWKENYEKLQLENKRLLDKLQNTKQLLVSSDANLSKDIHIITRKLRGYDPNNKIHYNNEGITNEGLLIICQF